MTEYWKNGILGVVVGDALGEPVQFESRAEVAKHPVKDMRGYGTFDLPEGSWTDDSSLTLALLSSINDVDGINLNHIMRNFVDWLVHGDFTPYGYSYDIGRGTINAINAYRNSGNPLTCGGRAEDNNGNGSLMRILPVCLYCCENKFDDEDAIKFVHVVSSLTHAHYRACIACGLYYFMVKAVLEEKGSLIERMQKGLNRGFDFYKYVSGELAHFDRLRNLYEFADTPVDEIRSSGYVVDTIEASVWSLITTYSYKSALLTAVNLGLDTDTIGAISGGIGGLYYGIGGEYGIPKEWINKVKRIDWICHMCEFADKRANSYSDVKP